jgi:L,D-transpeptidase YcbB
MGGRPPVAGVIAVAVALMLAVPLGGAAFAAARFAPLPHRVARPLPTAPDRNPARLAATTAAQAGKQTADPAEDPLAEPAAADDTTATVAADDADQQPAETNPSAPDTDQPADTAAAPSAPDQQGAHIAPVGGGKPVVIPVEAPPAPGDADSTASPDATGSEAADSGATPPAGDTGTPAEVTVAPPPSETEPATDQPSEAAAPPSETGPAADQPSEAAAPPSEAEPASTEPVQAEAPLDPVVAAVRTQLANSDLRKDATAADLEAMESFYGALSGPPLWTTGSSLSAKAQAVIAEIHNADDWGLDAGDFDLPSATDQPVTPEAQAADEIKVSLAVLKYACYARGARLTPSEVNPLFDQKLSLRNPKAVLTEIAASPAPDAYLRSLQPQQEQFNRLHEALLKARARAKESGKDPDNEREVQLLVINMERWRWMPRELGSYYVWDNVPEFYTHVIKNGKIIYTEKIVVGQFKYATPLFSATMRSIVFHPQWVVPSTILKEDLEPALQHGGFFGGPSTQILRDHDLKVSYQGHPIDADSVDWPNVDVRQYTFIQPPGPDNVLGELKFNFPNKHAIYMHDTVQPEFFDQILRTLSHGCIRVHDPDRLATLLLAQDKGWSASQVKALLAKQDSNVVKLARPVPVHLTYFTATVDDHGKMQTFADIYGIDTRMAAELFKRPVRFPMPAPPDDAAQAGHRGNGDLSNLISGLFGN